LINHEPVDAFSTIVHKSNADYYGRRMAERLKELIPRQMFDVPIQAAVGGRIISRETVKARRKTSSPSVTAVTSRASANSSRNKKRARSE